MELQFLCTFLILLVKICLADVDCSSESVVCVGSGLESTTIEDALTKVSSTKTNIHIFNGQYLENSLTYDQEHDIQIISEGTSEITIVQNVADIPLLTTSKGSISWIGSDSANFNFVVSNTTVHGSLFKFSGSTKGIKFENIVMSRENESVTDHSGFEIQGENSTTSYLFENINWNGYWRNHYIIDRTTKKIEIIENTFNQNVGEILKVSDSQNIYFTNSYIITKPSVSFSQRIFEITNSKNMYIRNNIFEFSRIPGSETFKFIDNVNGTFDVIGISNNFFDFSARQTGDKSDSFLSFSCGNGENSFSNIKIDNNIFNGVAYGEDAFFATATNVKNNNDNSKISGLSIVSNAFTDSINVLFSDAFTNHSTSYSISSSILKTDLEDSMQTENAKPYPYYYVSTYIEGKKSVFSPVNDFKQNIRDTTKMMVGAFDYPYCHDLTTLSGACGYTLDHGSCVAHDTCECTLRWKNKGTVTNCGVEKDIIQLIGDSVDEILGFQGASVFMYLALVVSIIFTIVVVLLLIFMMVVTCLDRMGNSYAKKFFKIFGEKKNKIIPQ